MRTNYIIINICFVIQNYDELIYLKTLNYKMWLGILNLFENWIIILQSIRNHMFENVYDKMKIIHKNCLNI